MKCAVIGSPISHSLSPQIHRVAYQSLGLDWTYERHEVSADRVVDFVGSLDDSWRGLSVTMPCKEAILGLGEPDPIVRALGVGNTVIFDGVPGVRETTRICNTDVLGIEALLRHAGIDSTARVDIFGNGATARSAIFALARLGVRRVCPWARDQKKTARLERDAKRWGVTWTETGGDLLISTIPSALAVEWLDEIDFPPVILDVTYDPWPTQLMAHAQARGTTVISGLDLLAAQASHQITMMTGQKVETSVLRVGAEQAIQARR